MRRITDERKRILALIVIMTTVSLVVAGITISVLYRTALAQTRERLLETAQSQARLIEAMARFDAAYSQEYLRGAKAATLSQIVSAHHRYEGFGRTGEFTLARREGDQIVWVLSHRHFDLDTPKPVSFDSPLAEPMRRALSGQAGTVVGLDYRGALVVAAYEPVAELDLGIVSKIDLVEVREPFVRAGLVAVGSALVVVLIGALLFLAISNPIITRLKDMYEKSREELAERQRAHARVAELQEAARRNERLADVGAIAAELVHEIGNPLGALLLQGQLLLRRLERGELQPEKMGRSAEQIFSTAARLDSFVKRFMTFARDQRLDLSDTDLGQLLRDITTLWAPIARERELELTLELRDALPTAQVDGAKLHAVVENLIKNSVEAMERGPGRITIAASVPEPGRVRVSVEDTGPGVPKSLDDVFTLFTTTKAEGTGLGLAIAKQIVEAHGGTMTHAPANPHGAIFHIELVVCRSASDAIEAPTA